MLQEGFLVVEVTSSSCSKGPHGSNCVVNGELLVHKDGLWTVVGSPQKPRCQSPWKSCGRGSSSFQEGIHNHVVGVLWCDRQLVTACKRTAVTILPSNSQSRKIDGSDPWACEIRMWFEITNVTRKSVRCLSDSNICTKSLIRQMSPNRLKIMADCHEICMPYTYILYMSELKKLTWRVLLWQVEMKIWWIFRKTAKFDLP